MQPNGISKYQWIRKIKNLGFDFVWNYVDTYDARFDCLSQIHPRNMTLSYRLRSMIQNNRFFYRKRLMFRLRNYLRFNGDEKTAALGFELSRMIKYHQNINLLNIYKITIDLIISFIKITLLSHSIPILSKFAPTLFYLPGNDKSVKFFQTMTIRDFEEAFEPKSLKKFISNNGFIIAHTYMSYTGHRHPGRIILEYDDNIKLNENSINGLKYLGKMIASGKVSNPTLGEYSSYFSEIAKSKIVNSDKGPKIIGGKVTYRAIR